MTPACIRKADVSLRDLLAKRLTCPVGDQLTSFRMTQKLIPTENEELKAKAKAKVDVVRALKQIK
jgi:hypothetical protein